jgi:hypothetical protein
MKCDVIDMVTHLDDVTLTHHYIAMILQQDLFGWSPTRGAGREKS